MFDSPDLVGDLEARLLAVERRTIRLDDDVRTLRRGLTETQQRIWAAWAESGGSPVPVPASAPCTVTDFPSVCPSLPCVIDLTDSYYTTTLGGPTVPLTYVPASLHWTGCAFWTLPNNASCAGPINFALNYTLNGDDGSTAWNLVMSYKISNFTTRCPIASVCGDATNQNFTRTLSLATCTGIKATTSFAINGSLPGSQCWPSFRNVTLSVALP